MKSGIILLVIAVIICIISFLPQEVQAKSSPEFIDYLTSIIYKDCTSNYTAHFETYNGTIITRDFLKEQITEIDNQLPRHHNLNTLEGLPVFYSCSLSTGQKYELKINYDTYYWRDIKIVDPATYNLITQTVRDVVNSTFSQVAVQGEKNVVNTGNNANLKDINTTINQIIYVNIAISISVSISASVGIYFLIRKIEKRKRKSPEGD